MHYGTRNGGRQSIKRASRILFKRSKTASAVVEPSADGRGAGDDGGFSLTYPFTYTWETVIARSKATKQSSDHASESTEIASLRSQ
jgi:hypothetical protein